MCLSSCNDGKQPVRGETEFQREINAEYKDATLSPLKEEDRSHFKALEFFSIDKKYIEKSEFNFKKERQYCSVFS